MPELTEAQQALVTLLSTAASTVYSLLPSHLHKPRVAIVCGSGLSGLADALRDVHIVPYDKLAGFQRSTGAFDFSQDEERSLNESGQLRGTRAALRLG